MFYWLLTSLKENKEFDKSETKMPQKSVIQWNIQSRTKLYQELILDLISSPISLSTNVNGMVSQL